MQIKLLVKKFFFHLKSQKIVIFKADEEKVTNRAMQIIKEYYEQENKIEQQVNEMLDKLEKEHAGQFKRNKMFFLLKKKLAKEQGYVL